MKKYEKRLLGFSGVLVTKVYIPVFKDEEKATFIMIRVEFIMTKCIY